MEITPNPSKDQTSNLIDVTLLGAPPPQASSTHERKGCIANFNSHKVFLEDNKTRRSLLNDSDVKQRTVDSSLGILDNISSLIGDSVMMEGVRTSIISSKIDTERELARELLRRCSESREDSIFSDRGKENNGNLSNLSRDYTPSTLTDSGHQGIIRHSEITPLGESQPIFKPTEISARSSVLSASFGKSFGSCSSPPRKGGISFDTTAAAELIAQYGDEEFQSGSRVGSRMLADELSWNQNYSYAMPTNVSQSDDKDCLELSCFSGIIGDIDLSVESCAGRKVSVGEFFQRKCGNIGHLQETDSMSRPNFGKPIISPTKHGDMVPLVDKTIMTEEPSTRMVNKVPEESVNHTKQHSFMSLSSIAQALADIDNGTPRQLVDKLILAKTQKKYSQHVNDTITDLVHPTQSSAFHSSLLSVNETSERDTTTKGLTSLLDSPRFSLDSKIAQNNLHSNINPSRMSFNIGLHATPNTHETCNRNIHSLEEHVVGQSKIETSARTGNANESKKGKKCSVYHSNITRNLLSSLDDSLTASESKVDIPDFKRNKGIPEQNLPRIANYEPSHITEESQNVIHEPLVQSPAPYSKDIKYENVTVITSGASPNFTKSLNIDLHNPSDNGSTNHAELVSKKRSVRSGSSINISLLHQQGKIRSHGTIVSARNTNELFSCIVGVSREAEIEVFNGSDRWMTCNLMLHQIKGSKENIVLNLPGDTILVEPDKAKLVKIGVNIRQMGEPIIAVINIAVSDMVTRSNRLIKHVMCFVPEEPQIGVTLHSGQNEIDFQIVAKKCNKTFPVILENKNNADLPIRIMINKQNPDDPSIFSIDGFSDGTQNDVNAYKEINYNLILKPHQQFTLSIQFNGISLATSNSPNNLYRAKGKLTIHLRTDELAGLLLKEIPLIGSIGVSKIDLVDTPLPIHITSKQSTPISLLNSGDVAVLLSITFVGNDESTNSMWEFSIKPNTIFLQTGEKSVFLVSCKSQNNNSAERKVFIKVTGGGNEYFFPAIGDCGHLCDQVFVSRCNTPHLQTQQISSPSSPHSSASNRSGNSGRHSPGSAASTSTVSGDMIPIQSTHAALVWSSVKSGKTDTKEFTILNKSENKIKLQVTIIDNNKSFKFLRERNAVGTSMLLVLQRMGTKEISVIFSPSNPGACAGKLIFTHYSNAREQEESSQRKTIFLYGYGGVSRVEISQAFKGTGGLMWLSLGHMNTGGTLSAKIKLQNTGDLCSYAIVKLTPKALYPAMISSWQVHPTELLLGPGEAQWVKLEFHPRREDLALLRRADVSHVGTITITHGDEPTRWRIRRLYNKLKDTGKLKGSDNETFKNIVFPLCKAFPGEALIQDLSLIKDSIQHLGDLCRGVSQHQVMLTMEVNADETLTMFNDNGDDTQTFYSICSDSSSIFTAGCDSYMPSEILVDRNKEKVSESDFTVTPAVVTLAPPFRTEATITVTSYCSVDQPFETILSHKDCLSVDPTEGMIRSGRSFPLKLQCSKRINKNVRAVLQIFMENQKQEVLITIPSNN